MDWSKQRVGSVTPAEMAATDGVDYLQGIIDGKNPGPAMARALNFWLTHAEKGRVIFEGEPTAEFFNPAGTVHGGWAATILDSAMACAIQSIATAGHAITSVEMKLNFVRPVAPGVRYICEGKVIHPGKTLATSEASLRTADGKLFAHATETGLIFSVRKPA